MITVVLFKITQRQYTDMLLYINHLLWNYIMERFNGKTPRMRNKKQREIDPWSNALRLMMLLLSGIDYQGKSRKIRSQIRKFSYQQNLPQTEC